MPTNGSPFAFPPLTARGPRTDSDPADPTRGPPLSPASTDPRFETVLDLDGLPLLDDLPPLRLPRRDRSGTLSVSRSAADCTTTSGWSTDASPTRSHSALTPAFGSHSQVSPDTDTESVPHCPPGDVLCSLGGHQGGPAADGSVQGMDAVPQQGSERGYGFGAWGALTQGGSVASPGSQDAGDLAANTGAASVEPVTFPASAYLPAWKSRAVPPHLASRPRRQWLPSGQDSACMNTMHVQIRWRGFRASCRCRFAVERPGVQRSLARRVPRGGPSCGSVASSATPTASPSPPRSSASRSPTPGTAFRYRRCWYGSLPPYASNTCMHACVGPTRATRTHRTRKQNTAQHSTWQFTNSHLWHSSFWNASLQTHRLVADCQDCQ